MRGFSSPHIFIFVSVQVISNTISIHEFEKLFKEQYEKLCAIANQYLKDIEAAEEVVQSTFVRLWESREKLNIEKSHAAYLNTAVRNGCLNQLKHLKIKEAYKEDNKREMEYEELRVDDSDGNELADKIKSTIEKLPEGRRKIFILSRYEGLKYKEIAERLNISVKTVENQMGSALKFLKSHLAEYMVSLLLIILFSNK